jgi:PAS domain S-box-containing protein
VTSPTPATERGARDDHLRLALDAGRMGTWQWDMASGRVEWDARLEEIFGFPPGGFDGTYEAYVSRLHPDEREAVQSAVRAAVAEARPYTMDHRIVWPDGTVRWIQGRGDVTLDAAGNVTGTIGCVVDVTDRKLAEVEREQAMARLAFLADASAVLAESLELGETLSRLVELAVPRIADGAILFTVEADGTYRVAAVRHVDRRRERAAATVFDRYPLRAGPLGLGAAIATGQSQLLAPMSDDVLSALADDEEHLRLLRELDVEAGLAVPLVARGRVIGVLGLSVGGGRELEGDALLLAEELAERAATAADNARLFDQARRAADRTQQLQRSAARLVAAATVEDVGRGVLQESVPAVGASAGVLAVVDHGAHEVRVVEAVGDAGEAARRTVPLGADGVPMAEAVRSRRALTVHDGARRTVTYVPLIAHGQVLGVLVWAWAGDRRATDGDDVLLQAFAAQAASALERALLYGRARTIADALQAGLAPLPPPALRGVEVAARYRAAGEGVAVGGDFYDFVPLEDRRWLLVVGDVCGRGPSAAALNAQVRYTSRALARAGYGPAAIAAEVNANVLADVDDSRFCTAVFALVHPAGDGEPTTVELVGAGHPPPLVLDPDGTVTPAAARNPLLGVVPDVEFTPSLVELRPGATLVVVTDGVLEARDRGGDFYDDERLAALLSGLAGQDAEAIADAIDDSVRAFADGVLDDDVAVVVVQAV